MWLRGMVYVSPYLTTSSKAQSDEKQWRNILEHCFTILWHCLGLYFWCVNTTEHYVVILVISKKRKNEYTQQQIVMMMQTIIAAPLYNIQYIITYKLKFCKRTGDILPLTRRMRRFSTLELVVFLTIYTPSSFSCTSSSTRCPRELINPREFTTWPACIISTSAEWLALGLNTTSLTFPEGISM